MTDKPTEADVFPRVANMHYWIVGNGDKAQSKYDRLSEDDLAADGLLIRTDDVGGIAPVLKAMPEGTQNGWIPHLSEEAKRYCISGTVKGLRYWQQRGGVIAETSWRPSRLVIDMILDDSGDYGEPLLVGCDAAHATVFDDYDFNPRNDGARRVQRTWQLLMQYGWKITTIVGLCPVISDAHCMYVLGPTTVWVPGKYFGMDRKMNVEFDRLLAKCGELNTNNSGTQK